MNKAKTLVVAVIAAMLVAFPIAPALADGVNADAGAAASIDNHSTYINNSKSIGAKRSHQILPQFPNAPSANAFYKDSNYKIWADWYWTNTKINLTMMSNLRNPFLKDKTRAYACMEDERFYDKPVEILTKFPDFSKCSECKIMGYTYVTGKVDEIDESAVMEALYHAKKETGAVQMLVLVDSRLVTKSKVLALGTVTGAGKMVGGAGAEAIDEIAVSGAGGMGIGSSEGWVGKRPLVKVVIFNTF